MSRITAARLLDFLKAAADYGGERVYYDSRNSIWSGKRHRGYVWGGQGQVYTQALADLWHARAKAGKKSVPSGRNKNSYYIGDCSRWIGAVVDDCSGLIVDAVRSSHPSFGDRSSTTLINQCAQTGAMESMPEVPGIFLWRSGHIGVYIGNGMQIEARGTDYGVVVSPLASQKWTKWGYSVHIDYTRGDEADAFCDEADAREAALPFRGRVKGASVNVRKGPGTAHERVCIAYNKQGETDELLLSNLRDGWYEVTLMPRSNGYSPVNGFISSKYVESEISNR